jgi:hypothetical protein
VDDDGVWDEDNFGGTKGDATYTHDFNDDHIGVAKVEAWDGMTMKTVSGNGTILNETLPTFKISAGADGTVGVKFTVDQDLTIYQLGAFSEYYTHLYNLRLWTEGGTLLAQISNPHIPNGTWGWFNNSPVDLYAGNEYIVSAGYSGTYFPADHNPGVTPDDMLEPTDYMYYSNSPYAFPGSSGGSSPLPLVDVRYEYSYIIPDILTDYADVHVENVAPTVEAGSDIYAMTGEPITFNGSFTDPGIDDTHDILWDFADGNTSSANLTPIHTYDSPGNFNVILTVTDDDGGGGMDYLTVVVNKSKNITDDIYELIEMVENLNLPKGIENALLSKLRNAAKSYEKENLIAAINLLYAFIKHVEAQRGKKIPEFEADELIESALLIIDKIEAER